MSIPKLLVYFAIILFGIICIGAFFKKRKASSEASPAALIVSNQGTPTEVELDKEIRVLTPKPVIAAIKPQEKEEIKPAKPIEKQKSKPRVDQQQLPEANRIDELFNKTGPKLPIVETITYKSRVAWLKGRPAWLSDYATYYSTSRHFIARSLNGKADYFKQDVADGDRFNVFRKDKNFNFHLVIDTSRCRMWFYYKDLDTNERVLLKTYQVGLGRVDPSKPSGLLTPLGKYNLGSKIAIYKPKMMGIHNGEKVEMIRIFGSRWIPFDKEVGGCTAPVKGYGIHGTPWEMNEKKELVSNLSSLGKYESDGCIRLGTDDMEELFSIIITKPTIVELVKDFYDAK